MTHIHYKNDFTLDISLSSDALGTALDPKAVHSITFYTRKNGRTYKVCYGANTLIAGDNIVTAVFDQPINLEPGVLKYVVEYELHDDKFPDFHKKINQHFVSDIELVQGNGETEIADLQAMFGETIDSKLDSIDSSIAELSNTENLLSAAIVGIREIDAVQNSSINMIEDILTGIHGGEAEQIAKLNSSVNKLEGDVSTLNSSVSGIENDITRMGDVISGLGEDIAEVSAGLAGKADVTALNNYYTKNESDTRFQPKGNYLTEHQSLADYPTNASIVANYAKKTDLNGYLTKDYADQVYINSIALETSQDEQNDYIARTYLSQTDANLNYVSYENVDEIIINTVDNNYNFQNKVIDLINTSTAVKDISTLNTNISNNNTNIQNVSTRLNSDYLTAQTVNADFVKNASLNTELTKYVLKSTAEETYLTSDDISTFKPIVFCTQEEYDALVENDQVDANTVYMLSGDQTGDNYLTPDDVSNFVTTDDISTFITENDVSIYLTKQEGQGLINQAYRDVNQMMGTDLGQITAQGGTVQNYLETNYTSKNDASVYLTSDDVSIYTTTSYVDTQIGNIQNILQTI